MSENTENSTKSTDDKRSEEQYEPPRIIDYGTLTELTLSGNTALSDGLMGGGS